VAQPLPTADCLLPTQIDTLHLGHDRVIAAHLVRGLIVDPGPASALESWLPALDEEPRGLALTHIHLDHAGATGVLVRRFPRLRVYVSEVGAPHLVDPSKLLASAARLYGEDNMGFLWGEVAPVPEENIVALEGGEEVDGFRVEHTPGHARHHVSYLDLDSGDAYVGDMAGVRIPPGEYTIPPTPPPEIDIEAWLRSLDLIEAWDPLRLRLTHFGAADDPRAQLDRVRTALGRNAERARDGDRDGFLDTLAAEIRAKAEADGDPVMAERLVHAAPPEQQWLGLERYWRKRRERDEAQAAS
jgi:glyoxylase-like metal-dependent hydrolase (beta-lactamase superfamily II)